MNFLNETDFAVTVCDENAVITYMNDKSAATFKDDGGRALLGTNLLDCHPEPSKSKLMHLIETKTKNVYTIEKAGVKKLIYQSPIVHNGNYNGFIELSLVIPSEIPHFKRD